MSTDEQAASPSEAELLDALQGSVAGADPLETTLQTDDQVIARVTDGIYRQPGSALRELISNAYDADATRVVIKTDRPRFDRIYVEDDGSGMSTEMLVRLLYHIGGSAKRTEEGQDLGIGSSTDPNESPGGRKLIGKIGIGLFSVAQLTHSFQVITKRRGDSHRTVASVAMRQYSETAQRDDRGRKVYEAGRAKIWRESASDVGAQGTTIVLDAIRVQTKETLQSRGLWEALRGRAEAIAQGSEKTYTRSPDYHIGTVDFADTDVFHSEGTQRLPWSSTDEPRVAFEKLVGSVWNAVESGTPNPRLESLFDYYLTMVWQLSVWAPVGYVGVHPFEVTAESGIRVFDLDRDAAEVALTGDDRVCDVLAVDPPAIDLPFSVTIDDLELQRPVRIEGLPTTNSAVTTPLLFIGSAKYEFPGVPRELSGGPLSFDAYILWAPKIAPTDHQGVIVRVHNATGVFPYDRTFLKFPVAEQPRMTHLTCEIFVREGFDDSLNIDRESFNFANPHVVVLTRWLHRSLRRVIGVEKRVAAAERSGRRSRGAAQTQNQATTVVQEVWHERRDDDGTEPTPVVLVDRISDDPSGGAGGYVLRREQVLEEFIGANARGRRELAESEIASIVQVLEAYDLLDRLSSAEVESLARALRGVIRVFHT